MLHLNHKVTRLLLVISLAAAPAAGAQTRTSFLSYGPSAAAAGMGEANGAYALDAGAVYYNPAAIFGLRDQVTASHWFLYDGARYNFVGVTVNNGNSAYSLAGTQFHRGNIEVRRTINDAAETASNSQIAAYGAYAGRFEKLKLVYGASIKWLKYAMYNSDGSGVSADLGFTRPLLTRVYSMGKKLNVIAGLSFSNLAQTGVKLEEETEKYPMGIKADIAFLTTMWPKYNKGTNKLSYDNLIGDVSVKSEDGVSGLQAGLQYTLLQQYKFRVGYNRGATFGLGYRFGDCSFDYAFVMKELADFHRIGFSYDFGDAPAAETTLPITEDFQNVYQKALRIYERFVRNSEDLIKQGQAEEARGLLAKAAPLNPKDNGKAKELLAVTEKMIVNKKTEALVNEANQLAANNPEKAAEKYFEAYALAGDLAFLEMAKGYEASKPEILAARQSRTEKLVKQFNENLNNGDFDAAEKGLIIIKPLLEDADAKQLQETLKDRKGVYVAKLVTAAMDYMQKNEFIPAYKYFKAAAGLTGDSGIADQMDLAKKKAQAGKKRSLEDDIYADKLYYKMAYMMATDEKYKAAQNELFGFDPFYNTQDFEKCLALLGKEPVEVLKI